jgi:ammonium transporter
VGGGLLGKDGALDFAGGTVVHINAGIAGLVGAYMVGKRIGFGKEALTPHSLTLTMVGASLLWVGWFGFNAGSAGAANGVAGLAFINTILATGAATLSWLAGEALHKGKASMLGAASGAVAGLVAVTPAAGFVGPMGSIVLGLIAGVVCLWGVGGLKKMLGADDAFDVFGVHGLGGIIGAILTAVFASQSLGGTGGLTPDTFAMGAQLWIQVKSVLLTIVWSGVVSFVAYKIADLLVGLRVPEEAEREGWTSLRTAKRRTTAERPALRCLVAPQRRARQTSFFKVLARPVGGPFLWSDALASLPAPAGAPVDCTAPVQKIHATRPACRGAVPLPCRPWNSPFARLLTVSALLPPRTLPLRIRGGGTKDFHGLALHGEVLDTRPLNGIVSYEPSELVVTARAGTPLSDLEAVLAEKGQCLPFEPPHFGPGATVGGMAAAGLSGPARASVGAVRDYLLGVVLINGRAELLTFGGQVMKNVAGYDVSRLMAGAWGTLGLLTEVSLKVLPVAPAEATLRFECNQADALRKLHAWGGQPLPLNASCWVEDAGVGQLYVRLRGAVAAVDAACKSMGGTRLDNATAAPDWQACREQTLPWFAARLARPGQALWRLSLPATAPVAGAAGWRVAAGRMAWCPALGAGAACAR